MKKVLVVLAAAAMLFAMASCSECTCKSYVNDEYVENSEVTFDKDDLHAAGVDKCSDLNKKVEVLGVKTEVKCR